MAEQCAAFGQNHTEKEPEDAMNRRPSSTRAEITVAVCTGLILITYLTSDYFLWKQSLIGKQAADAAKSAANTANETLKASDKQFRITERPYVNVVAFERPNGIIAGDNNIAVRFENSGRTPGLKLTVSSTVLCHPACKFQGIAAGRSENTIATGKILRNSYTVWFSPQEAQAINAGTAKLFFRGTIKYTDIFQEWHETSFCSWYQPTERLFEFCPVGNDAN